MATPVLAGNCIEFRRDITRVTASRNNTALQKRSSSAKLTYPRLPKLRNETPEICSDYHLIRVEYPNRDLEWHISKLNVENKTKFKLKIRK